MMNKWYARRGSPLRAFFLSVSICIASNMTLLLPQRAAAADPATVAIWGITQALSFFIRLSKSGANPTSEMIVQNRDMLRQLLKDSVKDRALLEQILNNDAILIESVQNGEILVRAIHHRIDVLGEAMTSQIDKIDNLLPAIREDIETLLSQNREQRLNGVIDTIHRHMRDLQDGGETPDSLTQHWSDYLQLKNALISYHLGNLTALIMPKLYLFEQRVWRALRIDPSDYPRYQEAYINRVLYELDEEAPGSLVSKYSGMIQQLSINIDEIVSIREKIYDVTEMGDNVVGSISRMSNKLGVESPLFKTIEDDDYDKQSIIDEYNRFGIEQYNEKIMEFDKKWKEHRGMLTSLTNHYNTLASERAQYVKKLNRQLTSVNSLNIITNIYKSSLNAIVTFSEYIDPSIIPLDVKGRLQELHNKYNATISDIGIGYVPNQ